MTTSYWIALGLSDLVLLLAVWFFSKNRSLDRQLLHDLVSERRHILDLFNQMKGDISAAKEHEGEKSRKLNLLAAETEQHLNELKSISEHYWNEQTQQIDKTIDHMIGKCKSTQEELNLSLEKAKRCKERLSKSLQRAETLTQFFSKDIPYDQIMRDVEMKKYEEAKRMLREGYPKETISDEVGLSTSEIELIEGIAGHQLLT